MRCRNQELEKLLINNAILPPIASCRLQKKNNVISEEEQVEMIVRRINFDPENILLDNAAESSFSDLNKSYRYTKKTIRVKFNNAEDALDIRPRGGFFNLSGGSKLLLNIFNEDKLDRINIKFYGNNNDTYTATYMKLKVGLNVVEVDLNGVGDFVNLENITIIKIYTETVFGPIYLDNVRVVNSSLVSKNRVLNSANLQPNPNNLIPNGDFELGLLGWKFWSFEGEYIQAAAINQNSIQTRSGKIAAKIECVTPGVGGLFSTYFRLKAGKYNFSLWLKSSENGGKFRWTCNPKNAGDAQYITSGYYIEEKTVNQSWLEDASTLVITKDIDVLFYIYNRGATDLFIDSVNLIPLQDNIPTTPKTISIVGDKILINDKPEFVVGIFGGEPEEVANMNINHIMPLYTPDESYLKRCEAYGLRVWLEISGILRVGLPEVVSEVPKIYNSSSIVGWYVDEPDHPYWTVYPDVMRKVLSNLKPFKKPLWSVVMSWADSNIYQYADCSDVISTDIYPIDGGKTFDWMKEKIEILNDAARGKSNFVVTEATADASIEQQKVLCYLPITLGCGGLFFWEYADIKSDANKFNAFVQTMQELKTISEGLSSTTIDSSSSNSNITVIAKKKNNKIWLIAVNRSNQQINSVNLQCTNDLFVDSINVLFESRNLSIVNKTIVDNFSAYGRHVYLLE